jgi:hypothetical protein
MNIGGGEEFDHGMVFVSGGVRRMRRLQINENIAPSFLRGKTLTTKARGNKGNRTKGFEIYKICTLRYDTDTYQFDDIHEMMS